MAGVSAFRMPQSKFLGGLAALLITDLLNHNRQVARHGR
jgi:hypothetical protein